MNISRKIAEGVAGWLSYEFHSYRGRLFGEKYLTTPIGNILSGVYKERVTAEVNHPVLNEYKNWQGRPPQIDFCIFKKDKSIEIAVESKWIGDSKIIVGDIIWDLIRLELLANNFGTKCYFVLAGQKKKLQELFESDRFLEKRSDNRTRPVLRLIRARKAAIRIDSPPVKRIKLIKSRLKQYPIILMPSSIPSGYPEIYPKECRNADFQVYVWEISTFKNKPRFKANESKIYNM
jgi:hypothetical protein